MEQPPIISDNDAVNFVFSLCVRLLLWLASFFGISYNTINIIIFCVIWPLLTLAMAALIVFQFFRIRKLKKKLGAMDMQKKRDSRHS